MVFKSLKLTREMNSCFMMTRKISRAGFMKSLNRNCDAWKINVVVVQVRYKLNIADYNVLGGKRLWKLGFGLYWCVRDFDKTFWGYASFFCQSCFWGYVFKVMLKNVSRKYLQSLWINYLQFVRSNLFTKLLVASFLSVMLFCLSKIFLRLLVYFFSCMKIFFLVIRYPLSAWQKP